MTTGSDEAKRIEARFAVGCEEPTYLQRGSLSQKGNCAAFSGRASGSVERRVVYSSGNPMRRSRSSKRGSERRGSIRGSVFALSSSGSRSS